MPVQTRSEGVTHKTYFVDVTESLGHKGQVITIPMHGLQMLDECLAEHSGPWKTPKAITIIKVIRALYGLGLKEAKDVRDQYFGWKLLKP